MKRSTLLLLLSGFVLLILALTNPSVEQHRASFKTVFIDKVDQTFTKEASEKNQIKQLLGSELIDNAISHIVSSDNYLVFSLTKLDFEGKTDTIGIGLLGNVYLFNDVPLFEKLKNID